MDMVTKIKLFVLVSCGATTLFMNPSILFDSDLQQISRLVRNGKVAIDTFTPIVMETIEPARELFFDCYKHLRVTEYKLPPNASDKHVLIFGRTGAGKSLLGNVLLNRNSFNVSDSTISCTKKTREVRSLDRKLVLYDTKGLLDTDDMKKTIGMTNILEKKKFIAEEIVSLWTSLSAGALDCVLLVTSIGRYSVDEVKMVEFVANHLFEKEGLLRERILIVITRSEPYLVENKTEAVKWLERESENDVFKHYLNLVDHDTNRIIFVDNRDVTRETDNFEKIRLLQNNHKMAQKVLDPIHQLKGGPVSILHVVKNLKEEITKIDEKIQYEKDEEEKKKLESERQALRNRMNDYAWYEAKNHGWGIFGSCLLGDSHILMANYSVKQIKDIQAGDFILDGNLKPLQVIATNPTFLGDRKLYQFSPNGPVFTPEHQFYSNLTTGQIGVMSKQELYIENPQMEENDQVYEFDQLSNLLQFQNGNVVQKEFQIIPYKAMDPSTKVYFLITSGLDGSYIANNFVSKHELPDFEKWPMTYATLGLIMTSCEIDHPVDTLEEDAQLGMMAKDLTKLWKLTIFHFKTFSYGDEVNFSEFDPLSILQKKNELLEEIVNDKSKMRFGQFLNTFGAKMLHEHLDDQSVPLKRRFELMKLIVSVTKIFLSKN